MTNLQSIPTVFNIFDICIVTVLSSELLSLDNLCCPLLLLVLVPHCNKPLSFNCNVFQSIEVPHQLVGGVTNYVDSFFYSVFLVLSWSCHPFLSGFVILLITSFLFSIFLTPQMLSISTLVCSYQPFLKFKFSFLLVLAPMRSVLNIFLILRYCWLGVSSKLISCRMLLLPVNLSIYSNADSAWYF